MADDIAEPAVQKVKTKWERVKSWCKDSLTIAWARAQYIGGALGAGLILAFSNYDFTQLAAMDIKDIFKMLGAVAIAGILTELARRRTL